MSSDTVTNLAKTAVIALASTGIALTAHQEDVLKAAFNKTLADTSTIPPHVEAAIGKIMDAKISQYTEQYQKFHADKMSNILTIILQNVNTIGVDFKTFASTHSGEKKRVKIAAAKEDATASVPTTPAPTGNVDEKTASDAALKASAAKPENRRQYFIRMYAENTDFRNEFNADASKTNAKFAEDLDKDEKVKGAKNDESKMKKRADIAYNYKNSTLSKEINEKYEKKYVAYSTAVTAAKPMPAVPDPGTNVSDQKSGTNNAPATAEKK